MNPGRVFRESMQELSRYAGPAIAPTRVLDVANIRLDQLREFFAQRKTPELFPGNGQRGCEFCIRGIVV